MSEFKQRLDRYREDAWHNVPGWVDQTVVNALETAAVYQQAHGVTGDALEIGVFHGRFFLALAAAASPGEVVVAVDVFDDQLLNIDHSAGDANLLAIFKSNIAQFAPSAEAVRIVQADSMTYHPSAAMAFSTSGGFRLLSVDGGHTAEHVVNDLGLVADIVNTGAVVFVDDWMSPHWPGVHEGYLRFMTSHNRNLAPVLYTGNKLMMTTISHHPSMFAYFREHYQPHPQQQMREVLSCGFRFLSAV